MKTKIILIFIIIITLVGAGAFYGGMKYGESKKIFPRESIQQFSQQRRGQRGNAGFISGEVIAKEEKSLTLKMVDGASKIIFFSDSTQISKINEASIREIEIGKQIIISGQQNSDGSYTAKTIQILSNLPKHEK